MYLKGSSWTMQRKRRRSNPIRIVVLAVLILGFVYINQFVVPTTGPLFMPTATPTRAPDSYLIEAQDLIKQGKINQAILTYQDAVKADPRNPGLYVTLARWQVLQGDLDGADKNVGNALLIESNLAIGHAVKGWILTRQGAFLDAETELQTAITLDQNSALAYAFLAELYTDKMAANDMDMNMMEKAREYSKKATDLDGSLMEVHRARGLVLENTGQSEEAIKELEAAIAIYPSLGDLYIDLGRNYRLAALQAQNIEYYNASIAALNKAITLRSEDPKPYAELAATYLSSGEFTRGAQITEQALERDPKDPYLYGLLGTMHYKLAYGKEQDSQLDEATLLYQQALPYLKMSVKGGLTKDGVQVSPLPLSKEDNSSILYRLRYGLTQAKLGDCTEALQMVQELRENVPGNQTVNDNAGTILDICKQQLDEGTATPEPTPTANK